MDELPTLPHHEGRHHPSQRRHRQHIASPETKAYQQATAASIYEYFDDLLDQRELERKDDLLSRFLDATVDGERLTREDILDICFLFLIAGLDTVTATLDCIFGYLVDHPEQRSRSSRTRRSSRRPSRSCSGGRRR